MFSSKLLLFIRFHPSSCYFWPHLHLPKLTTRDSTFWEQGWQKQAEIDKVMPQLVFRILLEKFQKFDLVGCGFSKYMQWFGRCIRLHINWWFGSDAFKFIELPAETFVIERKKHCVFSQARIRESTPWITIAARSQRFGEFFFLRLTLFASLPSPVLAWSAEFQWLKNKLTRFVKGSWSLEGASDEQTCGHTGWPN